MDQIVQKPAAVVCMDGGAVIMQQVAFFEKKHKIPRITTPIFYKTPGGEAKDPRLLT